MVVLLLALVAHAGKCTPDMATSAPMDGSPVRIAGIEKPDPYAKSRRVLIGREGTAWGMVQLGPCDFAGTVELAEGGTPYFTRVRLVGAGDDVACPAGATPGLVAGQEVRFLSVHPEDAYYGSRNTIEGERAIALAPDLTDGCWWGGEFQTLSGDRDFYFYKVAVAAEGVPPSIPEPSCPAGALLAIEAGARVQLQDLHPDDAYYASRSEMLGAVMTSTDLHVTEGCWFAGGTARDSGETHYFYKAAFVEPGTAPVAMPGSAGGACPDGALRGGPLPAGTPLTLQALHADDAYATGGLSEPLPVRGAATGQGLTLTEDCWYGGEFTSTEGTPYYFYKAAFSEGGASVEARPEVSCPAGALEAVPPGTSLRVLKVHPDDAYFSDRSRYEGRLGVAPKGLELQEGCFFSGEVTIGNGEAELYFYKAAVGAAP